MGSERNANARRPLATADAALAVLSRGFCCTAVSAAFERAFGPRWSATRDLPISELFVIDTEWQAVLGACQSDTDGDWLTATLQHTSGKPVLAQVRLMFLTGQLDSSARRPAYLFSVRDSADQALPGVSTSNGNDEPALRLVAGLAHDFNNVLSVIMGNVQLAITRDAAAASAGLLREAELGCKMAERMIESLRAMSQSANLQPVPLDAAAVVGNAINLFTNTKQKESPAGAARFCVVVDAAALERAIVNIVRNAIEAMPDGGTLRWTIKRVKASRVPALSHAVRPSDDFVSISISDDGFGMSPQTCARAFEPYFTTKTFSSGCGLGLAQVIGFAQQSGGGAYLQSALGKGTTVTLYLPCDDALGGGDSSASSKTFTFAVKIYPAPRTV